MLQNLLLLLHNTAAPCKKNYFKLQLAVQTFTHRWHKVMAGEKKSAQRLLLLMRKHHWMSEMCTFFGSKHSLRDDGRNKKKIWLAISDRKRNYDNARTSWFDTIHY